MKVNVKIDPALEAERADFFLQAMTPKISRITKELLSDQPVLWCMQDQNIVPVKFEQICLLDADNGQLRVVTTAGDEYKYSGSLRQVLELLPHEFIEASRNAIINYHAIDHLEIAATGGIDAILVTKERVQISRRKLKNLKERLGL